MKPLRLSSVVYFVGMAALMYHDASAQMQMRQPMPTAPQTNRIPRELATEDSWFNSIVAHWSASQRRAWRSLDGRFAGWASHLVWQRKVAGKLSGEVTAQVPHLASACAVTSFEAPTYSVTESMQHFRELMPGVDWNAWANIEPTFRAIAEWEMSTEHYRGQVSKALKDWWQVNEGTVRGCVEERSTPAVPADSALAQIDRRVRSEAREIDHLVAPEPVKQEVREQISDAASVDRYALDVGGPRP